MVLPSLLCHLSVRVRQTGKRPKCAFQERSDVFKCVEGSPSAQWSRSSHCMLISSMLWSWGYIQPVCAFRCSGLCFWICTSLGVFLCLHIIQQVMAKTRKGSDFLPTSLGRMKPTFEESLWEAKSCKCKSLNVHCEGPVIDRGFLHLRAWLEKRNWKPLWLSFGTQKPLPRVGKQGFTFVLCFWLNQHCLVVRSKEGKRRHSVPSSSKRSCWLYQPSCWSSYLLIVAICM